MLNTNDVFVRFSLVCVVKPSHDTENIFNCMFETFAIKVFVWPVLYCFCLGSLNQACTQWT